jgi:hypothetical protein
MFVVDSKLGWNLTVLGLTFSMLKVGIEGKAGYGCLGRRIETSTV